MELKKPSMPEGTYEIRYRDEKLDEVVAYKVDFFHLEQMDENHWWLRITMPNGKDVDVNFTSKGIIKANVY